MKAMKIEWVEPRLLRHIEGFSARRVAWLKRKVTNEGFWTKPVALDDKHHLVLDGQHRMEVALALGLKRVPAVKFRYASVEIWSLRPKYSFVWQDVVERALTGDIYPYKTVKHRFPVEIPACNIPVEELLR
jgi:hypothetical protein